MIDDGERLRAKLDDDCPPLDYLFRLLSQAGAATGMVCAERDAIRSRSGGRCEIDEFKRLVPSADRVDARVEHASPVYLDIRALDPQAQSRLAAARLSPRPIFRTPA